MKKSNADKSKKCKRFCPQSYFLRQKRICFIFSPQLLRKGKKRKRTRSIFLATIILWKKSTNMQQLVIRKMHRGKLCVVVGLFQLHPFFPSSSVLLQRDKSGIIIIIIWQQKQGLSRLLIGHGRGRWVVKKRKKVSAMILLISHPAQNHLFS